MSLYLACAVFGGLLLLLQLVGGAVGADSGHGDVDGHHGLGLLGHGGLLQVPSLRTIAAAFAGFGVTGAGLNATGAGRGAALAGALAAALVAGGVVALLTRLLLRFESDGAVRLADAVGRPATVYLSIPGAGGGAGKVQLALQGRIVDCPAIAADATPLATGAPVVVVDVHDDRTLVVAPDPSAPATR
jgi:hypothetical protein